MCCYVRSGEGQPEQIWKVTSREAIRLGVGNPHGGPGSHFVAEAGEDAWGAMKRMTPWFQGGANPFSRLEIEPRSYYPRIARPLSFAEQRYMRSPAVEQDVDAVALSRGQAEALTRRLDLVCQTVHPEPSTMGTYGHEIRNLLILAATEVEAHWRGVLVANGTTRDRLSTADYVRLVRPMRLDAYAIGFTNFPWLAAVRPFQGWDPARPTISLPWYDAYNASKHDRENSFARATLGHAMEAVAGCIAMIVAQYTQSAGLRGVGLLNAFYRLLEVPKWEPGEIYVDMSFDDRPWTPVPHPSLA